MVKVQFRRRSYTIMTCYFSFFIGYVAQRVRYGFYYVRGMSASDTCPTWTWHSSNVSVLLRLALPLVLPPHPQPLSLSRLLPPLSSSLSLSSSPSLSLFKGTLSLFSLKSSFDWLHQNLTISDRPTVNWSSIRFRQARQSKHCLLFLAEFSQNSPISPSSTVCTLQDEIVLTTGRLDTLFIVVGDGNVRLIQGLSWAKMRDALGVQDPLPNFTF